MIKFIYPEGATPVTQDDLFNLIPEHIHTQNDLNAWEQMNILQAEIEGPSKKHGALLSQEFMKALHLQMFNRTWKWAGKYRQHQTNIGCPWQEIPTRLKILCDDITYQLEARTYPIDELVARFHHRLVFIHPFPNGNGRFSRLMADFLLSDLGEERFAWGEGDLCQANTKSHF
jgi:Fic-DOC domain mobile mystery protein B